MPILSTDVLNFVPRDLSDPKIAPFGGIYTGLCGTVKAFSI